ncbi:hypothetical protein Poli38472_007775 [Pythium oligandrum]|uniref:Uncharacterized protein n=1 Tax=Pythium oligandrum TaxID=41045 RepID=A0A8K1CSF6_PYTOL|nr:hypothetical protein Poli38472_007775 [Pythium oligandrum]|eukprot:TMW68103.1 hypothetical protein Poli38472_007775 [Pythium oligandrum]
MLDFDCDLDSIFLDVIDLDLQDAEASNMIDMLLLEGESLTLSEPVITVGDCVSVDCTKLSSSPTSVSEAAITFSASHDKTTKAQNTGPFCEFGEGIAKEGMALSEDCAISTYATVPLSTRRTSSCGLGIPDRETHRKQARAKRRQTDAYKRKERERRQRDKMHRSILRNKSIALEIELRRAIVHARRLGSRTSGLVLDSWWKQSDGAIQAYRELFTQDWLKRVNWIEK